ncbi:MAG: hypothetical protein PHF18_11245 [Methanosarcina sp.]|uniref:hypothetical protein n=1 Tax=Methanosarcina sp. TaxID=2213 RepID=UPI00261354AF|nr:hypothetical protein [Methanosarcina sp.]MDD3247404.1 hypothetical protein [Methanosarcina sp.]MDD4248597.1 hypothetical protein [Methanosarcina sp.]
MRYIDIESKNPPTEWCEKAKELTEQLKEAKTPKEREKIIDDHNFWSDKRIKDWLLNVSNNKCWYSEAKEVYSFYDVDHFRPKKRAKQLDGTNREGYWWLAFDWKNYRISGSIGNRPNRGEDGQTRGKADYFPLRQGSPIAVNPEDDIRDEIIYLLDPTNPHDPPLLTFDDSGNPFPASPKESWEYLRVETTIKILHLDYYPLVEERKKIWVKCTLLMNEIEYLMCERCRRASVTDGANLNNKMKQLKEMISGEAELSSTAKACILSSGRLWAMQFACSF